MTRRRTLLLAVMTGAVWAGAELAAYSWPRYAAVFWIAAAAGTSLTYGSLRHMPRARRTYVVWALICTFVALIGSSMYFWPEAGPVIAIFAIAAAVVIYGLIRSARLRRGLLWTLLVALCGSVVLLAFFALTPYGMVLLIIGAGQLAAVLYFWPRPVLRRPIITREMMEPLPRGNRTGATLISVVVSIGIIAMCLTLALQAYLGGSRFVALESQRARATAACQMQIERARADGYAGLPAPGEHGFALSPDVEGEGRLIVAPGSVSNSRVITARVTWRAGERMPGGSVELVTIMTARGVGG